MGYDFFLPRLLYSRDGTNWELSDSVHCDDVYEGTNFRGEPALFPAFNVTPYGFSPTASSESIWTTVQQSGIGPENRDGGGVVIGHSTPQQYPPHWDVDCDNYPYVRGTSEFISAGLMLPNIGFAQRSNSSESLGYIYSKDGRWIFHGVSESVSDILIHNSEYVTSAWNGTYFVAHSALGIGTELNVVVRTSDGLNWTVDRVNGDCFSFQNDDAELMLNHEWRLAAITSANARFLAIATLRTDRSRLCESDDGVRWTTLSNSDVGIGGHRAVENGKIASNHDGSEIVIVEVTYSNDDELLFDGVIHITDGVNWVIDPVISAQYNLGPDYFSSVTWANGMFVAAGYSSDSPERVPIIYYKRG